MSNIKFVSHESFPDDPYTKELVYLCLEDKYRVAYVRKQAKNGGMFWSGISASIVKDNTKHYYEAFLQDSAFMDKDIKAFLEGRKWEAGSSKSLSDNQPYKPMALDKDIPF